jgi:hypothetical protein
MEKEFQNASVEQTALAQTPVRRQPPAFIKEFITLTAACARVKFAVATFNRLAQEKTVIKCAADSTASRGSRKRG